MAGTSDEILDNGKLVLGWVHVEESAEPNGPGWDDQIGPGTRYVSSMYNVLNALEHGSTNLEKVYAMWAELMRDFILGMVAGLMTTISMAMNTGDQEVQVKLRSLRAWMISKNVPKTFQIKIVDYCNEMWSNRAGLNIDELLGDVPPAMKLNLATFLYGGAIGNVPLFRGLADEVIGALCNVARPMVVLKDQEVMTEGQPGREMYILMSGELEVLKDTFPHLEKNEREPKRLGFLSEGSFFGETAILSQSPAERRLRTVRAVADCELCYFTREGMKEVCEEYAELGARLQRYRSIGQMRLTKKGMAKLSINKDLVRTHAAHFKRAMSGLGPLPPRNVSADDIHRTHTIHDMHDIAVMLPPRNRNGKGAAAARPLSATTGASTTETLLPTASVPVPMASPGGSDVTPMASPTSQMAGEMEELMRATHERLATMDERLATVDTLAAQLKATDRKIEVVLSAVQTLIRQGS